jgi:hypothetical protein
MIFHSIVYTSGDRITAGHFEAMCGSRQKRKRPTNRLPTVTLRGPDKDRQLPKVGKLRQLKWQRFGRRARSQGQTDALDAVRC